MTNTIILLVIISAFIIYSVYCLYRNKKWDETPIDNFPFYYCGKEYWYSRAVATVPFVFCKNKENKWCILANKRGKGTPDFQGYWNAPCGYLQFHVTGEENCAKEVFEETSVEVPIEKFKLFGVETNPSNNRQNVSLRYYALLDGVIDDYQTNSDNSEEDEVDEIKWIPLDEVENYKWAFSHDNRIKELESSILN